MSKKQTRETTGPVKDFFLPIPKSQMCTEQLFVFLDRQIAIFNLFFFGVQLATRIDEQRLIAAKALAKGGGEEDKKRLVEIEKNKTATFDALKKFRDIQSENLCIRSIDNFLSYISELIQQCMLEKPEMLKSNETVKLEDVLRFDSYDDLVSFLVDKKINELSYGGIKDISSFLAERTGLDLFATEEERGLLSVGIELRNIYTHNRGVVNDLFLKRLKNSSHNMAFEKGKRFHAEFDVIAELANNMRRISIRLDEQVAYKFKLPRRRYGTWKKSKNK